jgi:hypothetical protein
MIFNFAFFEMPKAFIRKLLQHFLEIGFDDTSRGRALAETLIFGLTSGDASLGKGSRAGVGCYDQCCPLQKVTSEDLLLRSGSG